MKQPRPSLFSASRRTFLERSLTVLGGVMLGNRFTFASQHTGDAPVLVGASLPLSGPGFFAEDGLRQLLAYRMWQEQRNERGGLLGRPVELVVYDDANDAGEAVAAYARLLYDDGADLLLGNYGSGMARVTIPVVEQGGMPCVFPMAWQPALWTQGHSWAVPLLPIATRVAHPLLDFHGAQGAERIAVIWAANDYARDLATGLREGAAPRGLEVAVAREYDGDEELAAVLREAAEANVDVLMGGNVGETIPHVVEVLRGTGVTFPAYGWFEIDEPVLLSHRDDLEGMTGFGLWLPTMPFPGNRRFVHEFTHRWEHEYPDEPIGLLIDHHSSAGYAAAELTQRAVETAGTLEPEAVRDALFAMDTSTVFGPYRLDGRGLQVGKEVPVVRYRHGLREVVWPESLAVGRA